MDEHPEGEKSKDKASLLEAESFAPGVQRRR